MLDLSSQMGSAYWRKYLLPMSSPTNLPVLPIQRKRVLRMLTSMEFHASATLTFIFPIVTAFPAQTIANPTASPVSAAKVFCKWITHASKDQTVRRILKIMDRAYAFVLKISQWSTMSVSRLLLDVQQTVPSSEEHARAILDFST